MELWPGPVAPQPDTSPNGAAKPLAEEKHTQGKRSFRDEVRREGREILNRCLLGETRPDIRRKMTDGEHPRTA